MSDVSQDGPNTHHYRSFLKGTSFTLVTVTYADGDQHTFHVPSEVVNELEAPYTRAISAMVRRHPDLDGIAPVIAAPDCGDHYIEGYVVALRRYGVLAEATRTFLGYVDFGRLRKGGREAHRLLRIALASPDKGEPR